MSQFERNIINLYGDKGGEWLANLPKIVKQMTEIWRLTDLQEVENLSYNYVLRGFKMAQPVILKIGFDVEALNREVFALKTFYGYGAPAVLDSMDGVVLLEQIFPGRSLINYFPERDLDSVRIVCAIMKRLYGAPLPTEERFPTIANWLTALNRGADLPLSYLIKARTMRDKLLKTPGKPKLLHGDLHHYNILKGEDTFTIIDPKGVIGEEAYEVASFIRNPIPDLLNLQNVSDTLLARIEEFAYLLKINPERIKEWCFVQSVLSWIWAIEDNSDPAYYVNLTKFFDQIE